MMNIVESTLLKYIGFATFIYYCCRIFFFVKRLFNESLSSPTFNFKKFGSWAVVTGASDGIGRALSVELAKFGMNLVLISRTRSKLEMLSAILEEKYNIKTKTIAVDFTDDSESVFDVIKGRIEGLDIALLLNNVGMAPPGTDYFLNAKNIEKFNIDICRVNVFALTKMTQLILPQMVERGGGVITNVSSVVATCDFPYLSLYCATKIALENFTSSLRQEYGSKGVIFQCLAPAHTSTSMVQAEPSFWVPSAEKFAQYAIKSLGKSNYTNTNIFPHNLFSILTPLFPGKFLAFMMKAGADKTLLMKKE